MQVKKTTKSENQIVITVVADPQALTTLKEKVLKHMQAAHVNVAGFRKGKTPLELVEKHADPNQLQSEFLEEAVNQMYIQALDELKVRPVDNPQVSVKKFVPFTELEFDAEVAVVGDITVGNYKKLKKTKPQVKITDKDVQEVIVSLQKRVAEKKEVTRAAKNGDETVIDFKGTDSKGKPVNGASGKDYPLTLGSDSFIPGFESNLIGVKPGETKTFAVAFPKDYGVKALQNKKVTFKVTVKKISELVLPKADDAFATQAGPFKSLQDLKDDIKKQLASERQYEADRDYENDLIRDLVSKSKVSVPQVLIDEQVERLDRELRQNITYRGLTYEEYLEREGMTAEVYRTKVLIPQAEERVKAGLILSEVAELENLTVTPEELEIRLQILKSQYQDPQMQAELDKPENRRDIAGRLLTEKTLAKLTEYAN